MKTHYDAVEETMFLAQTYWQTDLTSFINVWDTINDTIFDELSLQHSDVLGGHTLGSFGFVNAINSRWLFLSFKSHVNISIT